MTLLKKSKQFIYHFLINPERKKGFLFVEYFISGLIVFNLFCIIFETHQSIYQKYESSFYFIEIFTVIIFTLDYISRIFIADIAYPKRSKINSRLKYIFSIFGIIDLLSILPFYLPIIFRFDLRILRILRLVRIFRIFKLQQYNKSITLIGKAIKNKKEELIVTSFVALIILLLSAYLMFQIENQAQPEKFNSIFSSFWWALATLTTIGYGDIYPVTGWGQLLAAVTAIFGIGLIAIPTGIISMGFLEELSKRKRDKKNEKEIKYCPFCGEKLND